jgi:hypothetical protein
MTHDMGTHHVTAMYFLWELLYRPSNILIQQMFPNFCLYLKVSKTIYLIDLLNIIDMVIFGIKESSLLEIQYEDISVYKNFTYIITHY